MRITTIDTSEQREAVGHAAEACRIILKIFPTATMVELASENCPQEGTTKYDLWNIWADKAAADHRQAGADGQWLWCDVTDHPAHSTLTVSDQADIKMWLGKAGEIDPNVFEPGELAAGAWELNIPKVLEVEADDTAEYLVDAIEQSDLTDNDLDETIAGVGGTDDYISGDHTNTTEGRVRFLIERIGVDAASNQVEALIASR